VTNEVTPKSCSKAERSVAHAILAFRLPKISAKSNHLYAPRKTKTLIRKVRKKTWDNQQIIVKWRHRKRWAQETGLEDQTPRHRDWPLTIKH